MWLREAVRTVINRRWWLAGMALPATAAAARRCLAAPARLVRWLESREWRDTLLTSDSFLYRSPKP
jgi:hypothetical protein